MTLDCKSMGVADGISRKDHGGSPWHLVVKPWGSPWQSKERPWGHPMAMYAQYVVYWRTH